MDYQNNQNNQNKPGQGQDPNRKQQQPGQGGYNKDQEKNR